MVQSWNNADNLYLKYGPDKAVAGKGGEHRIYGNMHEWKVSINLADLTQTETIMDDNVVIPKGYQIQEVELVTEIAGATGTAIDVGLSRRITAGATTLTQVDYDGLLAAAPLANHDLAGERTIFTAATTVPASATGTGALIGTVLSTTGNMVSASCTDATLYTAGRVHVFIRAYRP